MIGKFDPQILYRAKTSGGPLAGLPLVSSVCLAGLGRLACACLIAGVLAPAVSAQHGEKAEVEVFEAVDPYTKGEREKVQRLGYVTYGPFPWVGPHRTPDVTETMGGIEVLWVETEHFRIGSSLNTYRIPNDKRERELIEADLELLEQRLGRLKPPKKSLDPWLRLHLYAQRVEGLYADFCERFGLTPEDFPEGAPYLGKKHKFLVLLCERKSSFGRFMRRYGDVETDTSYRFSFPDGGIFFGINAESLRESGLGLDSAMTCALTHGVIINFVDAYKQNLHRAPYWWKYGLAHWYSRNIDPRWTTGIGLASGAAQGADDWIWQPRVYKLVKNDFFASTEEMFSWRKYDQMDAFAHLVTWSKTDYLLSREDADLEGFLDAICKLDPEGSDEQVTLALVERQTQALKACFDLTPEELDRAWAKHVLKRYDRK